MPRSVLAKQRLTADAKNRALRSLLVGLVIDVGIALVLGLGAAFGSATGWGDLQWGLITFAVGKTVVQSIGSFLLRRVVDPSRVPSPLPPEDPGPPTEGVVPPVPTAVVENTEVAAADAEAEPEPAPKPAPKKRPAKKAVSPDDTTRRLQAEIDLAQTKAASPVSRPQRVAKKVAERKRKAAE